jgi:2-iminobutanoate/2-iminopropanoate deaminase
VTHHRRTVTAPEAPAAVGAYSHGVVSNGLLFCSGQVPLDPESGDPVEGDIGSQTTRCLESLQTVCDAAGARLADAVRLTLYLTDLPGDWSAVNEAYEAFLASHGAADDPPARVAIGVAALPKGAPVEIDAIVALPD